MAARSETDCPIAPRAFVVQHTRQGTLPSRVRAVTGTFMHSLRW